MYEKATRTTKRKPAGTRNETNATNRNGKAALEYATGLMKGDESQNRVQCPRIVPCCIITAPIFLAALAPNGDEV